MGTPGDIDKTWTELESGIDLVMNHLEEGMSYQKYMQWYTYIVLSFVSCCRKKTWTVSKRAMAA
jgi:hypothetical protein